MKAIRLQQVRNRRSAALDPSVKAGVLHFSFDIPQGAGAQGDNGGPGGEGPAGAQGVPGEVTNLQLTDAINTTSSNSNAVNLLGLSAGGNYDEWLMQQAIADKLDELITALQR